VGDQERRGEWVDLKGEEGRSVKFKIFEVDIHFSLSASFVRKYFLSKKLLPPSSFCFTFLLFY